MANFVFVNNYKTTVASAFSNVATSLTLASSVGLPTLSAGQVLPITLQDAATGLVYEICYATAITGATLTVTRAQEGTAAQNWLVGDRAYCAPTALSVAPVNGNGLNVFQVANAVAANEAVNLGQVPAITVNDATNAHYAFAGKNVPLFQDTNLETWADSLPRCGLYDVALTAPQGNLPAAWWHLELQRYSSDVAGNLTHIITAKGLNVAGLMYTNACSGGIWSGWIQVVTSIGGTAPNGTPVGTLIDFAGTAAPTGYLACPVAAGGVGLLARTGTYAALFAAIGTTWGAGDGSTTFQMPWFPADYASVQANGNVGTDTVGAVIAHTHTYNNPVYTASAAGGGGTAVQTYNAGNTGSTGGAANLPAGVRVLKCVKY